MSIEALKHALETLEEVQMAITTSQWMNRRIEALRTAIEQAEKQEPMAWCIIENDRVHGLVKTRPAVMNAEKWQPLYTAPPKKELVGLTDEEHTQIAIDCGCATADWVFYGAAVERKLKEKNSA